MRKISSAFDNEAKAQEALHKLLEMKDNNIFKGLRAIVTPGEPHLHRCIAALAAGTFEAYGCKAFSADAPCNELNANEACRHSCASS